ncbi:MSCRAMM family adhesin SdrC, partial [Staphylococcus epidermidis]|uniref:MSCRAMM family adhesin SdrC n=1 Tax=Staphylococcus epidermidis TaxID=1282 RepID=UPI001C92D662
TNTNDFYRRTNSTTLSYLNPSSTPQRHNPTYTLPHYLSLHKNKNPLQHHHHKPLPLVYLTLKHTNNTQFQPLTTHQSPHYHFHNLQNPTYTLHFPIPHNYTPSPPNNSTNHPIHSH